MNYPQIIQAMTSPWLVSNDFFSFMNELYYSRCILGRGEAKEVIQARVGDGVDKEERKFKVENGVAMISVSGLIAEHASLFEQSLYGGTSPKDIKEQYDQAIEAEDIHTALFLFKTPGGNAIGMSNLSEYVRERSGEINTVAFISEAFSAGTMLATACERVVLAENISGMGSIGVAISTYDDSEFWKKQGIKEFHLSIPKNKRLTSPPIDAEALQEYDRIMQPYYDEFVRLVCDFRGVSPELVKETDGLCYVGKKDLIDRFKLADEIKPLHHLMKDLTKPKILVQGEDFTMAKQNQNRLQRILAYFNKTDEKSEEDVKKILSEGEDERIPSLEKRLEALEMAASAETVSDPKLAEANENIATLQEGIEKITAMLPEDVDPQSCQNFIREGVKRMSDPVHDRAFQCNTKTGTKTEAEIEEIFEEVKNG